MDKMNELQIQDIHGIEMDVYKVVSPDEIVLRLIDYDCSGLLNRMNKAYSVHTNKKNNQKLTWNINNLCAVYIRKYGHWYRGKIVNMDVLKQTVSIYFYDMDLTFDDISLNTLWPLEKNFAEEKCGFVHCAMDKVVPLDVSDKKWPQHICDRLIEELKKYPTVYFAEKSKSKSEGETKLIGEIWIKKILMPYALKPLQIHWINLNKFMIGQVSAVNGNIKDEQEFSNFELENKTEFYSSFEHLKNSKLICNWLPPVPVIDTQFKAVVTYVDMQCCIYLQTLDSVKLLENITEELNSMFKDSNPEPINYKWTKGQMVTVKYHQNNLWYRGTIINIDTNEEFTVQFLDYGNVETCFHEDLRSALYNIDVPQLCFKGFFTSILPMTKNCQWTRKTLDFIHCLTVDKLCTVWIDLTKSSIDCYAIKKLHNDDYEDVCQYLVTCNFAHFDHIDRSHLDLLDVQYVTQENEVMIGDNEISRTEGNNNTDDDMYTAISSACNFGNEDRSSYFNFSLKNVAAEGTLCKVIEPTNVLLLIEKIDGVSINSLKDSTINNLDEKCAKLPILDKIIPGTAVIVFHNLFWKRGTIINEDSVFLVDFGIYIKLVKNDLKQLPPELFKLPMFSMNCRLANVFKSKQANAKQVIKKMSNLLNGVLLKIVGINNNKDDIKSDIVDVELYNDENEIAYQPLISDKLLIPINHV